MRCRLSLFVVFSAAALAQTFETAAIRESIDPEGAATSFTAAGKFTVLNQTVKDLTRLAFGAQVVRGAAPKWVETQKYDIDLDFRSPAIKTILQGVLEHRFKLKVHPDKRTFSGYALVKSKTGLKIDPAAPGPGHIDMRPGSIMADRASMQDLAEAVAAALAAPVVNETGAAGIFTFRLDWRPQVVQPGSLTTDDEEPNVLPDAPRGPSIFESLEQQLGLRLESRKMKLDVMVIDSAERP